MVEHDDEALGDIGLAPPLAPIPRRPPSATLRPTAPAAPVKPLIPEWATALQSWKPLDDLATRTVQVNFVWESFIQAAKVGVLVAAGGTGKTTFILSMFVSGAARRPFLGRVVRHGTFVLLSSDDSQEDLEGALARVVQAQEPPLSAEELELVQQKVIVLSLQGLDGVRTFTMPIDGAPHQSSMADHLYHALSHIEDLQILALDTLRQFSGGSSNDEQVMKITIAEATDLANATGAAVIFPHHTGKQNFRDGVGDMYAGSGSAAIADNCRFVLLLQTTTWSEIGGKVQRTGNEDGDPLVLSSTRGSLLVRAPDPIYMFRDGFRLGVVAGSVMSRDLQEDEKDRAVLRAVRQGAQSKSAIYAVVKGKKASALARVDELEGKGYIRRGSQGGSLCYVLTDDGARFLDYTK